VPFRNTILDEDPDPVVNLLAHHLARWSKEQCVSQNKIEKAPIKELTIHSENMQQKMLKTVITRGALKNNAP
jgi:hypothetical protein